MENQRQPGFTSSNHEDTCHRWNSYRNENPVLSPQRYWNHDPNSKHAQYTLLGEMTNQVGFATNHGPRWTGATSNQPQFGQPSINNGAALFSWNGNFHWPQAYASMSNTWMQSGRVAQQARSSSLQSHPPTMNNWNQHLTANDG